jgi:hypothetical protein
MVAVFVSALISVPVSIRHRGVVLKPFAPIRWLQGVFKSESINLLVPGKVAGVRGALCLAEVMPPGLARDDGRVHAVPVRLSSRPEFGGLEALFAISTEAKAGVHSTLGFDVSADGQRFVIPVVTTPESSSLIVVQNWEAQLPGAPGADGPQESNR